MNNINHSELLKCLSLVVTVNPSCSHLCVPSAGLLGVTAPPPSLLWDKKTDAKMSAKKLKKRQLSPFRSRVLNDSYLSFCSIQIYVFMFVSKLNPVLLSQRRTWMEKQRRKLRWWKWWDSPPSTPPRWEHDCVLCAAATGRCNVSQMKFMAFSGWNEED